ncbi:MAG: Ldh family oxidoreductase [Sphingomonadaceae bacterium]
MATENGGVVVMPDILKQFVTEVFVKQGMLRDEAAIMADHLVEADLRGVYSHGMIRIQPYIERLKQGGMNPRPKIRVIRETPGTALVDGDNGAGQVCGVRAMEIAIKKAKEVGVSHVGLRMTNHFGTCAYYAQMAAEQDLIGVAMTVSGGNIMAPWGGITPLLGNNPIGVAIPAGKERPVVLDMAMSVVAKGKIVHAMKAGTPIPPTWGLNKYGEPTTDAKEAFEGLVQPVGGYKGYAMSFVIGVLAGVLNRAAFTHEVTSFYHNYKDPQNIGASFQAIDIKAFMDPSEFKARVDEAIQEMHNSELARGNDRIYVPGEIEWLKREERLTKGVPVADAVWKDIMTISEESGIPLPPTV